MLVWLTAMGALVFLAVAIKPKDEQSKKRFFWLAAIVLIILLGCRNAMVNIGSDLNNYYRMYERAIRADWQTYAQNPSVEIGYLAINFALAKVFPWPQFILFAQAAFCVGTYFYFIHKNTNNVNIATICFVSFGAFQFFLTGFRQSVAICIGLLMFEVAKKKKWVLYLVLYGLAISMHQTAVVLLPIYLLVNMKNKIGNNVLVLGVSCGLLFFSSELLEFGIDAFGKEYGMSYVGNLLGGLVPILIYTIIFILCFVNKSIAEPKDNYIGLVRLLIVGTATYLLRYEATIMERISMYYTVAAAPLLAENIDRFKPGFDRRLAKVLCVICCIGLFTWRVMTQYGGYTFFWQ